MSKVPPSECEPSAGKKTESHLGRVRRLLVQVRQLAPLVKRPSVGAIKLARRSARGIFPPIGLLSVLALALLTANLSAWGANKRYWPYYLFLACGLTVGILLWRTPRKRYSTIFANTFGWLPVFLGAASYKYWSWYAHGDVPGEEFFHAAAEVLPVLLLAAIIDVRRTRYLESKQLVLPIAAVFLGELAALNVLAFGNAGSGDFAAVSSSLVVAIVALILAVMADVGSVLEDERASEQAPNIRPGGEDHQPRPSTQAEVLPDSEQRDESDKDPREASVNSA